MYFLTLTAMSFSRSAGVIVECFDFASCLNISVSRVATGMMLCISRDWSVSSGAYVGDLRKPVCSEISRFGRKAGHKATATA